MDASLAQLVTTAVAQGALGAAGAGALDGLLGMIRHRFRRDDQAMTALDAAESEPGPLVEALSRYIESDPAFAEDLRDWLKEYGNGPGTGSTPTNQLRHSNQISGTVHGNVIQGQNIRGRFSFRGLRGDK
ncbi:hypothetical protein ACIGEZ_14380 [Streptomyces sp. NPDC085481]|uniref:hypothetical protein n=1 Tax=Streptomyces sp. NPDC085481 TaxID=3365727 RepID=UPI0037D2FCCF